MKPVRSKDDFAAQVMRAYDLYYGQLHNRHVEWAETMAYVFGAELDGSMVNGRYLAQEVVARLLRKMRDGMDPASSRFNFLLGQFRALVGNAVQTLPQPIVAQMRDDWDAAESRDAQEVLLRYLIMRDQSSFAESQERAASWAFLTGTGFFGVQWDRMDGPPAWTPKQDHTGAEVYDVRPAVRLRNGGHAWQTTRGVFSMDPSGQMRRIDVAWQDLEVARGPSGQPIVETIGVPDGKFEVRGNLRFFAPNSSDVIPDPAPSWERCPGLTIQAAIRKEMLVATFGSRAKDCDESLSVGNSNIDTWVNDVDVTGDEPLVHVLYRFDRPSPVHPVGRYGIVAGGKTLWKGPLPVGRLPVEPIYDTMDPSSLWGISSLRQGVPVQRAINANERDTRTIVANYAHPKPLVWEKTLADGPHLPTEPGAQVRLDAKTPPNKAPSYMQQATVPAFVQEQTPRLVGVVQDVVGVHGPSMGDQSGIQSGRQAAIHQASDARKFTGMVNSLARATQRVCKTALLLWRENADPTTTLAVYGPDGEVVGNMQFYRDRYLAHDMEVTIQSSSLMPYNEEIRRQQLMELQTLGLIESAEDFWRMMGRTGIGTLRRSDYHSRVRAREEVRMMRDGKVVMALDFEDHAAHLDVHLQFMRSPMFYRLGEMPRKAFMEHFRQHYMLLMGKGQPSVGGTTMYGNAQQGLTGGQGSSQPAPRMLGPGQPALPMDEPMMDAGAPSAQQPWTNPAMKTGNAQTQAGLDKEAEGAYGLA